MISRAKAAAAGACLALVLPASAAPAKVFCSEPVTPFCAGAESTFEDDRQRQSCREDVADYVAQMHDFVACLGTRQVDAAARAEALEARFACMAQGRDDCRQKRSTR